MEDDIIRLSVSEAAKFFGLEQRTIRRALKNSEISYVIVRGRYRISFKSLLSWSQGKSTVKNKLATKGIGRYVEKWKITNVRFSPNPALLKKENNDSPVAGKS
ncbi:MAG: helix-turn-helix domain-containing protein [Patescibacteria group bacterium]|nr:helix-turn-helix domain-containing protein [Patescibacteria group bacterium]